LKLFIVKELLLVVSSRSLIVPACIACFFCWSRPAAAQHTVKDTRVMSSLLKAETDFSKDCAARGQQKAFLKVMAGDAILFKPDPVNGPGFVSRKIDFKGILTWTPTWAEISKDGYFGYTTGQYTYLLNDSTFYGEYLSIWKRDPYTANWQLFVDAGIVHPKPKYAGTAVSYPLTVTTKYPKIYPRVIDASKNILLSSDVLLATLLNTRTVDKAYKDYLSPEATLLVDGRLPVRGVDSITAFLAKRKGSFRNTAKAAFVSFTRDLGFTYGSGEFISAYRKHPADYRFSYVRIWKKALNGLWRIAVEMQIAAN